MIFKRKKGWDTDPCGIRSEFSNPESGCWKMKLWNEDSSNWKKKEWNRDPNTWNGKFLVDPKLTKKKIEEILS